MPQVITVSDHVCKDIHNSIMLKLKGFQDSTVVYLCLLSPLIHTHICTDVYSSYKPL